MKKVLIIGMSSTIGGVETYILNLLETIDKSKFQIDFLVQNDFGGIYKEKILNFGSRIYEVPNFKKHPLKAYKELKKIYSKNKYDVIHANLCNASSILYTLPAANKNIKIIAHSHTSSDLHKLQHYICRFILNRIVTVRLACSDLAAKWMFGKYASKSIIVKNAISMKKLQYNKNTRNKIRKEFNLENKFVIGHVGRFSLEKNHEFLIEVFKKIYQKNKDAILLLIGTGPLLNEIKNKVFELKLEKNVLFLGTRDNVYEFYQAMDLFLLPSIFEGLPISGIEAQASGLKCLFSDNISLQAAITKNVEFLPITSSQIWADKILKDIKKYNHSNVEKEIIKNGYDLTTEIKKIERIYL